uniref:Apolipoprotein Bb, tandem duplicate 2 n=1 Tax=Oryzias latipes TaxID=8090 RepID=A0A3P9MAN0_ORYLA
MGDSKLCLLLLLGTTALAFAQDETFPTCLLDQRYKALHKYEYQYEAESLNSINGASQLQNGPRVSCKVEIEVPQTCSFIIRTSGCSLSEVADMDADGNAVFRPAVNSETFAAEMERYPLKVVVEGEYDVKLYPEDGETSTILNFKRGIVSALAVPSLQEDKNKNMPTIHGRCRTSYNINAREDIITDINLNRDLSRCDKFVPIRDHNSPLALITGMHYPLSQLVRSSQTCNYKFDNEKKHMTSGSCTETHILIPFSHKGKYGVTNVGKQELTLVQVSAHNDRVFDRGDNVQDLHMEAVKDKSAIQDKEAALTLMRELVSLPDNEGERRAHLFQKLVSMVRGLTTETLSAAVPDALGVSRFLTYQVLAQCGTPECSSAIMQILRTFDTTSPEVDAAIFALGFMSNPSALLINDMLQMAKFKSSKPIMYALSNVVKRFYKAEKKLIPEIHSVAEFMADELGDCTGDQDHAFLTLRVIGNMAPAVFPASPALRKAVLQCVNQPAAGQQVQQAAIQAYRQIPVPQEARKVLMEVLLNSGNPVQQRIAAYLVLMKDPETSELAQLDDAFRNEDNDQLLNFVMSHIINILSSTDPETQQIKNKINEAMKNSVIAPYFDPMTLSSNYKLGSLESNMIYESGSYLPKEVMLDMTLKAFGFEIDMMEIGMEGKGFEPAMVALFGEEGFFPDTTLKAMYFVNENMPDAVSEMLQNIIPALKNKKKRENLIKEIGQNIEKLLREMKAAESPEAMVYLRLLGNELGYLKSSEIASSAQMMFDIMFKMISKDEVIKSLFRDPVTNFFAHYIFMDNEFFLPTVTGVPLRVSLSGTFAPGFKGGIQEAHDRNSVSFMPSAGLEFVTQVGSHIPEFVDSGLEMHTNLFHESGIKVEFPKVKAAVKLTIPAPTSPTKLLKVTNTLVAVVGSEVKTIPPLVTDKVDISKCSRALAGMKICTALQYTKAFSHETAPYFPFTGDSKFSVELHPTGDVTGYSATIAYEQLKEGEEGRQRVDSLKFVLRAEGAYPTEATTVMMVNIKKKIMGLDIQIPDLKVEEGIRFRFVEEKKGKETRGITFEFLHKNLPELTLIGRTSLKDMKEGMLKVQLLVPSLKVDASVKTKAKIEEELELELESDIKVMGATSKQKIELTYDGREIEAEVKSEMNTQISSLPNGKIIEKYGNQILDMKVGKTDMKVRHIFRKFVEAANNYMEKYGAEMLPYIQNFRLPNISEVSLPEKLFLNTEAKATYTLNDERIKISVPVLFGGKSRDELKFPPALSTPRVSLPQFGLEIPSRKISIPDFVVPEDFILSIPVFGKAEFSTKMESNLYDIEASMAVGKDVVEPPSYSAKFDVKGTSPIEILTVAVEGSGMVSSSDSIKAKLRSALAHKFIQASFNFEEDILIEEKISLNSVSKIEASSPLGLSINFMHTAMAGVNTEKITGEHMYEGAFKAGPIYGKVTSGQSFAVFPLEPKATCSSRVQIDSTVFKGKNTVAAKLAKGDVYVLFHTSALEDVFRQDAKLQFQNSMLSVTCETAATAIGLQIRNLVEAAVKEGKVTVSVNTNCDHFENKGSSMLTASFDKNGLVINSDANVKLFENEAIHKATLKMNKDGLITSGTSTLQSPLSLENVFSGEVKATGAVLSITNKAAMHDIKFDNVNNLDITPSSFHFTSQAEAVAKEYASYKHKYDFDLKPYIASAVINNNLELLGANFINEAVLNAELYKMDLTGSLKTAYAEEEVKLTYQVNYADLSANAKCSTTGKLFGTHMNHNTELEIVGLAATFNNEARFNSHPMRFDHTIRCSVVPFDFNLDAIFNADGDVDLYGKHSAQLFGKFYLRTQPLAFAASHESRASMTHQLDNGVSLLTTYDNKMDTVLSPQEQKSSFKIRSKMNEHAFNEDIDVYNTADRIGVEVSGTILTNIINTASDENQEFTLSGFLKYDKKSDSHIISFPLAETLPKILEDIKGLVVHVAEALQNFMNDKEVRAKLEALPQQISASIEQMNIEGKITQLKDFIINLTQNFAISKEDVEASLRNLNFNVKKLLADLTFYIQRFTVMIKDTLSSVTFPEPLIQKIDELWKTYQIKEAVLHVIESVKEMVREIDLEELKDSSIAILQDIELKYEIKAKVQAILNSIRTMFESFDVVKFAANLQNHISTNLSYHIRELGKVLQEVSGFIFYTIQENVEYYDIIGKINAFNDKVKELIVKFQVDKQLQTVLEKAIDLLQQMKIKETILAIIKMIEDADIPSKFSQNFQRSINYLKESEVKYIIDQLNALIETVVENLKALDYKEFVNLTNEKIAAYNAFVNEQIRTLEIPHKLEATREFINAVLSSIKSFMEHLREIKVAEITKSANDLLQTTVWELLKKLAEDLKKEIRILEVKTKISFFLNCVHRFYTEIVSNLSDAFTRLFKILNEWLPDQPIITEIQQIFEGLLNELKKAEINVPSFTIPLTDLDVPSTKFSVDILKNYNLPSQLKIPEFTFIGLYTFKATTISSDDIKQKMMDFIDFIVNFDIQMLPEDSFFGDLRMNYFPTLPDFTLPEFPFSDITFPSIPVIPAEKLVKSLEIPEIKLPAIPKEIMLPCFGKLYAEINLNTPVYVFKTAAEFKNATESKVTPVFTGLFSSEGTSQFSDILTYKFNSTTRISIPKRKRVVVGQTIKLNHVAFGFDHQGSVTFYSKSVQAQAKTTTEVSLLPIRGKLQNTAFIAIERGMTATSDTEYSHNVQLPLVRSEFSATQKTVLRQDGNTVSLTSETTGKGQLNDQDGTHNSKVDLSLSPTFSSFSFSGDTNFNVFQAKQLLTSEFRPLHDLKFNVSNDIRARDMGIDYSTLEASGLASLREMKIELEAKHNTKSYGVDRVFISNGVIFRICPVEFFFNFQNKGNAGVNIVHPYTAKVDLQNDYLIDLNPDGQKLNAVFLARFNPYKISSSFRVENNRKEVGVFAEMKGEANLDFLTKPISIPEIDLPFIDFHSPATNDLNVYELTGLQSFLTTTDQAIDAEAKIVYQKSNAAPLADILGLIPIPSLGNLITELSFKSAIINLNTNAGLFGEEDLVFRLSATTASVFEALTGKLEGTSSLTTKRGIKLANSLSLKNPHLNGNHDSTISVSTDTLETAVSVGTSAKIALPVLNFEVSHTLVANTQSKADTRSTLKIKGDFDIPLFKAIGKLTADHSLKIEETPEFVSVDSVIKSSVDGKVWENYIILGALDNDAHLYVNERKIRISSKLIADTKLNQDTAKIVNMDVNKNLALEASMDKIYAVLEYTGHNEANLFGIKTTGEHSVQSNIDFTLSSGLKANFEIDMRQPSDLSELTYFEKLSADVTSSSQKISFESKLDSLFYTSNVETGLEGNFPAFTAAFKSSASTPIVLLDHDVDGKYIKVTYLL